MEWGVTLTPPEQEEIKALNVQAAVEYCIRMGAEPPYCPEGRIVLSWPERAYESQHRRVGEGWGLGGERGCHACPTQKGWYRYSTRELTNGLFWAWAVRLPWRPGARPDYSDFIEPVRNFLCRMLDELERRLAEARESAPSDEWLLEEEFDSFSWRTLDSGVEVAERKLRVIRR